MKPLPVLPLLLLLGACAATTQGPRTASAPAPNVSIETAREATRVLSSDEYGGRAPTTPSEDLTVNYISQAFQRAGLQPGNNGSWVQQVPMVEISVQPLRRGCPAMVDANRQPLAGGSCQAWPQLRITGGTAPMTFNYRTDFVGASYRVTPQVSVANSDVVFVGYGINAPERGWNDYAGLDVRGKTVVILINDPDWQSATMEGPFNGRAMTYYGRWTYKFEEAARQGAAAALIVHDTAPASYGWMTVENSWTGPQLYPDNGTDRSDQTAMNGWLNNEAARRLLAAGGQDLDALTRAAQQRGFRAVPLTGVRLSTEITNTIRRQNSRNVVGILPGRTRPNDYVVYTAHWDHLGECRDSGPDRICNGAVDNASGTAALIALAEAQARAGAADRSIVFLAVTGEESGLLGSAYYADHPIFPLARTVGGVNIDGLNMAGATRNFVQIGGDKSEIGDVLRPILSGMNLRLEPEPSPQAGYYYRSDHFSFARQGVPMLYAKAGEDLVNGGEAAGRAYAQSYRANRYHGIADEFDPNWDWSGAQQELNLYYRFGRALATGSAWPNWREGDEFRAIRDRSAAERR